MFSILENGKLENKEKEKKTEKGKQKIFFKTKQAFNVFKAQHTHTHIYIYIYMCVLRLLCCYF